jgi:hypothetical protein
VLEIVLSYPEGLTANQLWRVLQPNSSQLGHKHMVKFHDPETNELVSVTNALHLN